MRIVGPVLHVTGPLQDVLHVCHHGRLSVSKAEVQKCAPMPMPSLPHHSLYSIIGPSIPPCPSGPFVRG